ncbi:MAG: GGDEF domain-containing phosphodiesterase, partial [Spirochaetaceae bacterium]|nr:GGDEF domain-containing phosphodiesterase [Spirochaetaceae bacterium]
MAELSYSQQIGSFLCFGVVLLVLIATVYIHRKLKIHSLISLISLLTISSAFLFFEAIYVLALLRDVSPMVTMQLARLQELSLVFFIPGLLYFLESVFDLPVKTRIVNRVMAYIAVTISLMLILVAFMFPDSFMSVTHLQQQINNPMDSGRGEEGLFFMIRDLLLGLTMIYSLGILLVAHDKLKVNMIPIQVGLGLFSAFFFAFFELLANFTGSYLIIPMLEVSRLDLGLTTFAYIAFIGVLRYFLAGYLKNRDLTEALNNEKDKLARLAAFDMKTNTYNRRIFLDHMDSLFEESESIGIVMLDIEGFHDLNEAFGNLVGDEILIQAAQRIQQNARSTDRVYRMGSDEFAIILLDLEQKEMLIRYVEVLHALLSQVYKVEHQEYFIHSSMGIVFLPDDASNAQDALSYLFSALRAAKQKKSSLVFFNPKLRQDQERKAVIAHRIRESLAKDEFYVLYQPIVDQEQNIISAEALIRWREHYFPDEFIPLAESAGLMQELGTYIFNLIIRDLILHPQLSVPVHVNLSPEQFREDDFASMISARLQASGIEKKRVGFEITESFMMRDEKSTVENLKQLQEAGYSVALDDFGTGYSSLSYLNKLPIDSLKIDKAFVDNVQEEFSDDKLILSIIDLGQKFNLRLIAEGVERE